jgi:antitoxin (DNA-binding transcriptional repressor) of toxin-antitoxin stability system
MRTNVAASGPVTVTHEGTPAARLTPYKTLRRAVLSAMLWEDAFYETGSEIAKGIAALVPQVKPEQVAALAVEARERMYLRHVPLFLVRELARVKGNGPLVANTLARVIQRPDELGEYLALYWREDKDAPLSAGSKRGLARAFRKFSAYALAKYDRDAVVKLRDVLRLTHAKPADPTQAALWKQVIARTLETPDTWEVALSGGKAKRETWERLLTEKKLGGLAFLRNLRNMTAADVDPALIRARFDQSFEKVLPFRFIAAARHVPRLEADIERAMLRCLSDLPKLGGTTALIIDTSPSMWQAKVSAKSELDRFDAAAALAILARELCESVHVWAFNERSYEVPARRGFALRDALAATKGSASMGGLAVAAANERGYDRIIVLTDGQWHYPAAQLHYDMQEGPALQVSPPPLTERAYMINVAPYKTGIGYGAWRSVDGWSERILDFVVEAEAELP